MNMKILKQLTLILAICLAAEALVAFLPFAFPSSVAAILILAILLGAKLLKEQQIQETARRAYPGDRGLPAVEYGAGVRAAGRGNGGRPGVVERAGGRIPDCGRNLLNFNIPGNIRNGKTGSEVYEQADEEGREEA